MAARIGRSRPSSEYLLFHRNLSTNKAPTDGDLATGADAATILATIPAADTGSGVDTATAAVRVTGSDTVLGVDTASVAIDIAASDSASGADTARILVVVFGADTGAASDSAPGVGVVTPDAASGFETATGAVNGHPGGIRVVYVDPEARTFRTPIDTQLVEV